MVNIAFTVTPMSAPGSATRLALFSLTGTHRCCLTWGFGLHPSPRQECVPNAAVYFKAISPMTLPHRFLVSLHIHDTTASFRISPCPLCFPSRILKNSTALHEKSYMKSRNWIIWPWGTTSTKDTSSQI